MSTWRHYCKVVLNIVCPILLVIFLIWALPKVFVLFMPFIFGYLLACLANPLVKFLTEKCKIRRKAVSVAIIILVLAIVSLLVYGVVTFIGKQIVGFVEDLPDMWLSTQAELESASGYLSDFFAKMPKDVNKVYLDVQKSLSGFTTDFMSNLSVPTVKVISETAKNIPGIIIAVIMGLLSSYFFIVEKENVTLWIQKLMPKNYKKHWEVVKKTTSKSVGGYVKAQLKIEVWMYLLLYLGLAIARVKYAALVAFGIAVLDVLPLFGTGTVLVPWAIIKFLSGDYIVGIVFLALWGGGQLLRQIIQPKIVGESMGLPTLPTLIILYLGWKLAGVAGMVFALPVALILLELNATGLFDSFKLAIRYLVRDITAFCKFTKEDEEFIKDEDHSI